MTHSYKNHMFHAVTLIFCEWFKTPNSPKLSAENYHVPFCIMEFDRQKQKCGRSNMPNCQNVNKHMLQFSRNFLRIFAAYNFYKIFISLASPKRFIWNNIILIEFAKGIPALRSSGFHVHPLSKRSGKSLFSKEGDTTDLF